MVRSLHRVRGSAVIFFNAVCDVEGCQYLQPLYFETDSDTFGEAKKVLQAEGWRIASGSWQKEYVLVCPCHTGEKIEDLKLSACDRCIG